MAQRVRPVQQSDQVITIQSSLTHVKTLLDAGIGCIAYLRGLFPEDSFSDAVILAPRPPDTRGKGKGKEDKPSTVRVKRLKRGASGEGDKLLNYIEVGASEALEKGYLHQLIFAIYLDPDEPSNLVESYTFTFTYETDSEGKRHPEMKVHDQMQSMILTSTFTREEPRKEGEVKRQVQQLIKNLITSTQLLDELPRHRFINVRLHYTDDTPEDYEPPHFQPKDANVPDYTITTPSINDLPETSTLGGMETGYHGVALHTLSIAHVLQTSYDDTISKDEATTRNQEESRLRPVVWNAQTLVESVTDEDQSMILPQPIGVKDFSHSEQQGGVVLDLQIVSDPERQDLTDLRKRVGLEMSEEKAVLARGEMESQVLDSNLDDNEILRRAIAATNKTIPKEDESFTQEAPVVNRQHSFHPPVLEFWQPQGPAQEVENNSFQQRERNEEEDVKMNERIELERAETLTQRKQDRRGDGQSGMVESQLLDFSQRPGGPLYESNDTIINESSKRADESAKNQDTIQTVDTQSVGQGKSGKMKSGGRTQRKVGEGELCECGDPSETGGMVCCSSCDQWRHNVCYGYDDAGESLPDIFECYRCRAHTAELDAILEETKTREGEIKHALTDLQSLALFRRAIQTIWEDEILDSKELGKIIGIDSTTASQILKRLKQEEFIIEQTARKNSRSKTVKKTVKKPVFIVNKSPEQIKYKDSNYFSPGQGAERPTDQLASGSKATSPRVLVEATPSPSHAVSAASASSLIERHKRNKTLPSITEHEDPNLSDASSSSIEDDEEPRITPEDAKIAARQSAAMKRSTLSTSSKNTPQAPVAAFDSLGNGQNTPKGGGLNGQISDEEDAMQLDDEPTPLAAHSNLKRTASSRTKDNEENRMSQGDDYEGGSARKRKKVSQAERDVEAE
ncbi:hypothetical protein JCM5353_007487 [Sporobolomyces roseus]